jgi:hypothetical protein
MASGASSIDGDNLNLGNTVIYCKSRDTWLEIEPPRSGGAGIYYQSSIAAGDELFVSMAVNQDFMWICGEQPFRSRAAKLVSVADMNLDAARRNDHFLMETGTIHRIGVSIDGLNWRNDAKLLENFLSADVACVQNETHASERLMNRSPKKSMRVRNESDDRRRFRHASYITCVCRGHALS